MNRSASKLLVVGLDAVESPLLEQLMDEGRLPVLASLVERGVSASVQASCMSTLPGAIWQDIITGRSAEHHGDYYPSRIHTGEAALRLIDPTSHAGSYFFDHAAAAGMHGIVVDQPLVPAYEPEGDLLTIVAEWHVHDAIYDRGTYPKSLLADLEDRFGARPYDRCDTNHDETSESLQSFAAGLQRELAIKIDMVEHLMTNQPWNFVSVGISQGHCAGHQLWGHHDEARVAAPDGEPVGDLVIDVYRAIDEAIGRLIATAGPDCGVVVFTSHGMENYVAGPQLLPALIEAWGYQTPGTQRTLLRKIAPKNLLGRLFRAAPWLMKAAAERGVWTDSMTPHTTAISVPNNRVGAIRLNLAGREPDGTVTDVVAVLGELEARLHRLRHDPSGEPIVLETIRTADRYGLERHPDLPDLLVVFRRDLGEITKITCPEAGSFDIPVRRPQYQRTGDHTDESRIWIDHPAVTAIDGSPKSEDIAATLLALLGVDIPVDLDGKSVVRLGDLGSRVVAGSSGLQDQDGKAHE